MDTLQSILLKRTQRDPHSSRDAIAHKPKKKKRSESLEAIFRLPKSVLDKFRPQGESMPIKRERSRNQRMEETIELGNIGQEYHHNLRKTILNQAKPILNSSRPSKTTHQENNFMLYDENNYSKALTGREDSHSHYENNLKTLNILQKAIIKEDELFLLHQNVMELQANRLPIIRKKNSKRRQLFATYEEKRMELSPSRREVEKQRHYTPYAQKKKGRDERMEIRGWDTPEFTQF